ncbi:MAG: DUF5916 domain-containing protein [Woeseiaceae bacterium]
MIRWLALALLVSSSADSYAQESVGEADPSGRNKIIEMVKTDTPPILDGVVDEIWRTGAIIDDLHQVEPVEYAEPTEKTIFRVLYDENFLYVAAEVYYEDPDTIIANKMIQGTGIRADDKIRVFINPFNDGRNGYIFSANAYGIRTEGIIENVTDRNFDWTGIWYASSAFTDYGFFTEIAIPYKTISFDPNSEDWGFSVFRSTEAKTEDNAWTSYNRSIDPSNFGTATGLQGIQQGKGLDIVPSASATYRRQYDPSNSNSEIEPSLDAFYKFTPNLTGALTLNSDFSATNVDDRQVQLSRFSIFFPEQRKFFLQEADIFEFGGLDENGTPFFSRRIGIGPSGEQLDLEVGGKLTGRIGNWNIGALAVQQAGNAGDVPDGGELVGDSDLFVGRVSANVLAQSTIGGIVTYGNPTGDLDNKLIGVDFNYLNTRSFENITFDSQIWYQKSDTEGATGDQSAYGIKLRSPNETGWKAKYEFNHFGESYFPALGFANRTGIDKNEAGAGYTWRFGVDSIFRSVGTFTEWQRFTDPDGNVESETFEVTLAEVENQTGDEAALYYLDNREVLAEPFEISDGIVIPVGDYSFGIYGASVETGSQRRLRATVSVESGDFYSGDIQTAKVKLEWAQSRFFTGIFEFEYNDIDLLEGAFEARLLRLRTDVAFNPEWAWITTAQYDNQSDVLGVNSRLQWIPKAGTEFYIIYNGGWIDEDITGLRQIGESATIKLSHTFRF